MDQLTSLAAMIGKEDGHLDPLLVLQWDRILPTDRLPVHGFETLIAELATRARVTYSLQSEDSTPIFKQVPEPTQLQARAYELIELLPPAGNPI